jgi:3-methyladenine DNA glycosylase/8-oxoguanine DNA glycosylase
LVVTQFCAVRTYVLTDIIECQEEIPDITVNCIKLNHCCHFASRLYGWYIKIIIVSDKGKSDLKTAIITLDVPKDFNFWRTVYSHGWCSLRPFSVDKEHRALNRILTLTNGSLVLCEISEKKESLLNIKTESASLLTAAHRYEIKQLMASCLRLTENFSDFYRETRRYPNYRWIAKIKAGRMLRSPSVFEDIVKMVCTTNCSWAFTEIMINNLVEKLGESFDNAHKSFPSPEALAGTTDRFLRKQINAGYRSPFLLEFAEKVASGSFDIECWRSSELTTEALFQELRSVKGVGAYSAGNILKLLGRYDYLGLDSWSRGKYYEMYHRGRTVSDRTIERRYAQFGKWRGLFFWLDMTKYWYNHEFPF